MDEHSSVSLYAHSCIIRNHCFVVYALSLEKLTCSDTQKEERDGNILKHSNNFIPNVLFTMDTALCTPQCNMLPMN